MCALEFLFEAASIGIGEGGPGSGGGRVGESLKEFVEAVAFAFPPQKVVGGEGKIAELETEGGDFVFEQALIAIDGGGVDVDA